MQNNYYFIRALSATLATKTSGLELLTSFSQSKDELMMGFADEQNEFWIRATFTSELTTLSFPEKFARAKKNSIDLFEEAIGKKVVGIRQFQNERAFGIELEDNLTLLFKLFGNQSNILLLKQNEVIHLFENQLQADWGIDYEDLDRSLSQEKEDFLKNGTRQTFPTFGKEIKRYLNTYLRESSENKEENQLLAWTQIEKLLDYLEGNELKFYVFLEKGQVKFSLLNPSEYVEKFELLDTSTDPIEAINAFYYQFSRRYYLSKEKTSAIKFLEKRHRQTTNYIEKTSKKLSDIETKSRHEEFGHLLMANLHQVEPRSKSVEVTDFYNQNELVTIPLKDNLSAQKNAELYYRKAKNQKIEIDNLYQNLAQKEKQLADLENHIEQLETFSSLKELRKYLKANKIKSAQTTDNDPEQLPFKSFEYEDFQILVGKNSKNNDLLTQKFAYKEDLWLHARGVAGSHVVIKYRAGKPFPNTVIEKAASLAAYYSKRKNDSLCPVIVTPKKFVRKPKGAALGAVVVEREEVLMVEPRPFE